MQHAHETVDDPQARAPPAGSSTSRRDGGDPVEMVASPVDFAGTPWAPRSMSPEFAQHTEEVLLELGHDWDRIIELKDSAPSRDAISDAMDCRQRSSMSARSRALSTLPTLDNGRAS